MSTLASFLSLGDALLNMIIHTLLDFPRGIGYQMLLKPEYSHSG